MLERFVGRLLCSLALLLLSSSVAVAADGNKEVFSPWTSAPSCVAGRACIYQLGSDKQLYGVDGNGVVTKLHGAKSFRTSMNCAGLSGPASCMPASTAAVRASLALRRYTFAALARLRRALRKPICLSRLVLARCETSAVISKSLPVVSTP